MTDMRSGRLAGAGITLSILLTAAGAGVRAQPSVIAGQAVGHVVLGMQRADVWKVLKKPGSTDTVMHGGSLYGEDTWSEGGHTLVVISEHDKVIQVEFDSPHMTTTDGLTAASTLAQVRRLHPAMTVRLYGLEEDKDHGSEGYYLDDVRRGIAFRISTQEAIETSYLNGAPGTIIIHRTGRRAVPIYEGRWSALQPPYEDPDGLRLLRSWFTPGASKARQ